MIPWLCIALALGAMSLLAVFRATAFPIFFLAVGATEFGHLFAIAAVLLAIFAPLPAACILGLAAGVFLSPLIRAFLAAGNIHRTFLQGLGIELRRPPVHPAALWLPAISHGFTGERIERGGVPAFDFYRAKNSTPAPLIVLVHGGGWMAGNSSELAGWNSWLAARGYAVAAVEYRLAPAGIWPSQREDVMAATEYLRAHAMEFGIDPGRIVFLGRSAGGQIVSAMAANSPPWLRGCVCLYSPFDMLFAYEHSRDDDMLRSRWLMRCYLGGTPDECAEFYHDASAYLTADAKTPPFLIMHGGRDELVWVAQSRRFAQRLTELGVPNAFVELPWATHAFDYNMSGPGGQITAACLDAFLRRVCG
jgi:acetyl esterase/lipase